MLPRAPRGRPITRRTRQLARVALPAALLLLLPYPAGGREAARSLSPLSVIAQAFTRCDPDLLRPVLPATGKIYVAAPALGLKPAYYSRDQVFFTLEDAFRGRSTVRFEFREESAAPPGSSRIVAIGRWSYRVGSAPARATEIGFTLVRTGGVWTLREIREIR